jgi:hypothetical protein
LRMDDFGDIFGKLFEKPEMDVRNCENCNSGIRTKEGLKCCINKRDECIGDGEYKHWTPLVVIGDELSES